MKFLRTNKKARRKGNQLRDQCYLVFRGLPLCDDEFDEELSSEVHFKEFYRVPRNLILRTPRPILQLRVIGYPAK